jgi:multisubunit Na+/H+ antiporter MnhG subunit
MKTVKLFAWLGAIMMASMIIFSLVTGDFFKEGSILINMVWGQMSMVDLYVGFILFYLWIFKREKKTSHRIIWLALILTMGNLITAVYILKAAYESKTDLEFFLGK